MESAASPKQLAKKKPGTQFVIFFGDNQWSKGGQMACIILPCATLI